MYNQIIIDRFKNINNLYVLKNANVKVVSKKNEFGDVVKFFAQINSENVIQKISYQASGCTTFVVICSYFCELVEGKSIEQALKITDDDLKSFCKLDDSKIHVYKIILDTFALLIKKYKKGIQDGKIIPCEVIEDKPKKISTTKNKENKEIKENLSSEKCSLDNDLKDILTDEKQKKQRKSPQKSSVKKTKTTELIIEQETTVVKKEESLDQKLSHLSMLNQKIQTKDNLNSILNKLNSQKVTNIKSQNLNNSQKSQSAEININKEVLNQDKKNSLNSIRNSLSNLKKSANLNNNIEKSEDQPKTEDEQDTVEKPKKEEESNKVKKQNKVKKSNTIEKKKTVEKQNTEENNNTEEKNNIAEKAETEEKSSKAEKSKTKDKPKKEKKSWFGWLKK